MIQRSTILRGPAVAQFNGATIFPQGDIAYGFGFETFTPGSSMHGALDERIADRFANVKFTPVGEWESLSVLWPYRTALIGTSLFTGTDVPLVIHTLSGTKLTAAAAAITQLPEIYFGAKKTMIGEVGFTCIGKDNTAWDSSDSFVKIEALAFPDATWAQFDLTKVVTGAPTISWGLGTPVAFVASEGVTVSFDLSYDWIETDAEGKVDATLGNLAVMAKFKPLGVTETQVRDWLKIQDVGGLKRGMSLDTVGFDLTIANSLGTVVVKNAAIKTGGFKFGNTTLRHDELGFVAVRTFAGTAGKPDPLFTIA